MRGFAELGTLGEVRDLAEGRLMVSANSIGGKESVLEPSVLSLLCASTVRAELAKLRDLQYALFPGGCYKKELVPAPHPHLLWRWLGNLWCVNSLGPGA